MIHNGLLVLYATDVLHDIVNVTASKNWSEDCVKLTKNIFGQAVGMLYVQQYNPNFLELLVNRVTQHSALISLYIKYIAILLYETYTYIITYSRENSAFIRFVF